MYMKGLPLKPGTKYRNEMISSKLNDFVETSLTSKFAYKHDKPTHKKMSRFYFREQVAQVDPGR
jgi:hypothetical protein